MMTHLLVRLRHNALRFCALALLFALVNGPGQRRLFAAPNAHEAKVIGLDPLSRRLYRMYQQYQENHQDALAEGTLNEMKALCSPTAALAAMRGLHLSAEHAQYHPHATKECDLLKGLNPGDVFDAAAHAEAIISDSLACPICNPRHDDADKQDASTLNDVDPSNNKQNEADQSSSSTSKSKRRFYANAQVAVGQWVEITGSYDVGTGKASVSGVAGDHLSVSTDGDMTFEVPLAGGVSAKIAVSVEKLSLAVGRSFKAGELSLDLEVGVEYQITNPVELAKHGLLGDAFDPSKRTGTGTNRDITDEDVRRALKPD